MLENLPPITDSRRGERLQRVMADAGVAARRVCEQMILDGDVKVNGRVVDRLPAWVNPEVDRVEVKGRVIPKAERPLYIMLNKPTRTLSTAADEPGADRRTVVDLVDHPSQARLFPVGLLDYDTTGLVLLTNDGELANRLSHPRYEVPKTYLATVRGQVAPAELANLEKELFKAERRVRRASGGVRGTRVGVEIVSVEGGRTVLRLTLKEGRNRQVRTMLATLGHPVKKIERVAIGPLQLSGVAVGRWRELTRAEVKALKEATKAAGGAERPRESKATSAGKRMGGSGGRRRRMATGDSA